MSKGRTEWTFQQEGRVYTKPWRPGRALASHCGQLIGAEVSEFKDEARIQPGLDHHDLEVL